MRMFLINQTIKRAWQFQLGKLRTSFNVRIYVQYLLTVKYQGIIDFFKKITNIQFLVISSWWNVISRTSRKLNNISQCTRVVSYFISTFLWSSEWATRLFIFHTFLTLQGCFQKKFFLSNLTKTWFIAEILC